MSVIGVTRGYLRRGKMKVGDKVLHPVGAGEIVELNEDNLGNEIAKVKFNDENLPAGYWYSWLSPENFTLVEEDKRKYPLDLAYQIKKLERTIENFKNSRNKNDVKYKDLWDLQEKQAELLLELAKQHNVD